MFIYGQDIPLDDAVIAEAQEPRPVRPIEPVEYLFTYGDVIFPEDLDE